MDGVSWSTTRSPESFSRSTTAANTLSRLASFIARAETKQHVHNQRQQPSQPPTYVCPECDLDFPYSDDLLQHQEVKHTLPKPHRCPTCGQEFSLRSSLQLHQCDRESAWCECCHGLSRLGSPCSACTTRTSGRLQDKSLHRQPHLLDSSPYACAPCGRGFSQKQALLHHQQAGCSEPSSPSVTAGNLPDDSPPASEGDSGRSDYSDAPGPSCRAFEVCRFCSRNFSTEAALHRHIQNNHVENEEKTKGDSDDEQANGVKVNGKPKEPKSKKKLLECRSCDMVFRSTSKLYVHRKEKHSRQKSVRREPRPTINKRRRRDTYPCQVCGKVFVHHLSLRAHHRRHTVSELADFRNRSQSVDGATTDPSSSEGRPNNVKTSLEDHKITVRGGPGRPPKVFNLNDGGSCRKVPEVEDELEVEKEFPCPSCAEVFSLQRELREHVELHQSSIRSRQCSVCAHEMDTCKWPGSRRQRLYHCVPCQEGFSALDSFLEHCQEHLRVRVEEDRISEGCHTHQASRA